MHLSKIHVLLVAIAAAAASGTALATWSFTAKGAGAAKAAPAASLSLADASAYTTADLYPGASTGLTLRVTNANKFPVRITAVSATGSITSDKGAACDAGTGVSFTNKSGLSLDVGAGATATLTVPDAVSMSNASSDACQGAVFHVPVSLTAVSNA